MALAIVAAGCASAPPAPAALAAPDAAVADFAFARDTFAFANEVRAFADDRDDLYANYCFVVARGLRQFFQFARFDPAAPRLDRAGYLARVRQVVEESIEPAARVRHGGDREDSTRYLDARSRLRKLDGP